MAMEICPQASYGRRCVWEREDLRSHECYHNTHSMCLRAPDDCDCSCHVYRAAQERALREEQDRKLNIP